MKKTKVTIKVDGLGEQTVYVSHEDAVIIYASVGQEIVNRLLNLNPIKMMQVGEPLRGISQGVVMHERALKPYISDSAIAQVRDIMVPHPMPILTPLVTPAKYKDKIEEPESFKDIERNVKLTLGEGNLEREVEIVVHEEATRMITKFTGKIFSEPKLVMCKCPSCNIVTARKVTLGESDELKCHFCKEYIQVDKVIFTQSVCPNCGKQGHFYSANGLSEFECIACKSPIDIVYFKDESKALSANLIKRGSRV